MKRLLISVEGIDGCGKSTLAKNLSEELKKHQLEVVLTREPGQTKIGERIKSILYEEKDEMCAKTEFLLFAANRAQHFEEIVIPALNEGKIVISDRMGDSSLAYQGFGLNLDVAMLEQINSWTMNNIKPDFTIYIKLDEETAFKRIKERSKALTPFEKEKKEYWTSVINGYDTIFENRKDIIILDGKLSEEELTKQAIEIILKSLSK